VADLRATVVILTFNGEVYLRRILESLSVQEFEGEFEVLVIDSGSTDSTLEIVADFPEVRLHRIPNHEFGHGRTRNLAASLARGDYVAYLTHDAVPLGAEWLTELLAPFGLDPTVRAVMGKQVPRPTCFPLMRYEIEGVFAQFGPDYGTHVFYDGPFADAPGVRSAITFYSDVNSAAPREFLTHDVPYRDVPYAEDQLFGQDVVAAGYHKAYAPRAAVEHSNDLTLGEFGPRIFEETVALRRIGTAVPPLSGLAMTKRIVRGSLSDARRIARDGSYRWRRRFYWLVVNPMFHVRKWRSFRAATLIDPSDDLAVEQGSREPRLRGS
jgi:rhamnosyltransferase